MSRAETTGRPAVFLDRDGTINEEKNYLHRIEDFEFIPGAPEAIRQLNQAGYLVLVVTNQSGVARGFFSLAEVDALHRHMVQLLAEYGARIDGFYVCPHHPTAGQGEWRRDCSCRKGQPGLLLQAAAEHDIDLARSYMIGDKAADIEAGQRAGCSPLLVLTGYGQKTALNLATKNLKKFVDLQAAAEYICRQPA
jgi:D-glycero-D-manno-heptose 1,7-bisphosphate phosphatase